MSLKPSSFTKSRADAYRQFRNVRLAGMPSQGRITYGSLLGLFEDLSTILEHALHAHACLARDFSCRDFRRSVRGGLLGVWSPQDAWKDHPGPRRPIPLL